MKTVRLLLMSFFLVGFAFAEDVKLDTILKNSVMIRCGHGQVGSGSLFKNGSTMYVWTAAHILNADQRVRIVIDTTTGGLKATISYSDVEVVQPIYEDGRKVGEIGYLAKILRFSDPRLGGDDLGLLQIYKRNPFPVEGVSFLSAKTIPKAGDAIWHVGSMAGEEGINTPGEGMFTVAGRLRRDATPDEKRNAKVHDQISVPALPGCSGGGVFLKSTGELIGILTHGPKIAVECPNFIVPARRIHEFAKRTKCEWAVDPKVKPPEKDDHPIADCDLPLPRGWKAVPIDAVLAPKPEWAIWVEKIIRAYWR